MDRKTWIIVIFCLVVIGLNFYYSGDYRKQQQEKAQQTQTQNGAQSVPHSPDARVRANTEPGLVVPPVAPDPDIKDWIFPVYRDVRDGREAVSQFKFTNFGGALRSVEIMRHAIDSRRVPDANVVINKSTETRGIGTLVSGMGPSAEPIFEDKIYTRSDDGSDPALIQFVGRMPDKGLVVTKTYTLKHLTGEDGAQLPGSYYMVNLEIKIQNELNHAVRVADMGIFAGGAHPVAKSEQQNIFTHYFFMADGSFEKGSPSDFTGGWFSSAKRFQFISQPDITYAGVMSQYFVTAIVPDENSRGDSIFSRRQEFHLSHEGDAMVPGVVLAMGLPVLDLQPKEVRVLEYKIYTGPKLNQVLRRLPNDLDKVMAYGWFTFLSAPMNWLLNFFHGWVGNWGIAIICMTIVVRLCIWPLHKKSYMAMRRMSLIQPKLQELKEKYGNDQQKMSTEMMALYKKYGINPLSGCLPLLIQLPIFFAFYRVLQYSAELRGQPFFLWMQDLSLPDTVWEVPLPFESFPYLPINILPVLMAASMIMLMKMTPKAGDKMQQRIMAFMPWLFFLFCYNFASALALYWTMQNLISMGQNLLIKRLPQPVLTEVKGKQKKGFFQRVMEQQRVALEQQQQKAKSQGKSGMRNVTPKKKGK